MAEKKKTSPNFGAPHVSYSLNSLKGVIWGTTIGVIKGDTRSLGYSSCQPRELYHVVPQTNFTTQDPLRQESRARQLQERPDGM